VTVAGLFDLLPKDSFLPDALAFIRNGMPTAHGTTSIKQYQVERLPEISARENRERDVPSDEIRKALISRITRTVSHGRDVREMT